MDTCQLRPAKSARETGQNQSCVSKAQEVLAPRGDDPADVCGKERGLSVLRGADGAADSFESFADNKVAGRGRRVAEARGLMRLGDRSQPAGDRARRQCGGTVGDVQGNRLRRRGENCQLVLAAPGLEVAPVISVSLECGGGLGCGDEGLGLLDQFFKAGCFRDKRIYMRLHWDFLSKRHRCAEFRGGRNSKYEVRVLKGNARSFRGEVGNYGRGRSGRNPLGCKSEQSAVPTDEANNRY